MTVDPKIEGAVLETAKEGSVFELTRDLFERSEQEDGEGEEDGGVDWGFGNDHNKEAASDPETASLTGDEAGEEDDDDVTVEMEARATAPKTVFDMELSDDEELEEKEMEDNNKSKAEETKDEPEEGTSVSPDVSAQPKEPTEEGTELTSPSLRRSHRTPKKRDLAREEDEHESEEKQPIGSKKDKQKKKKKKSKDQPDEDQLLQSTDYLFGQADKDSVTVADMYRSLEAEFDCKLAKATRKMVKEHLIQLMTNQVQPSIATPPASDDAVEPEPVSNDPEDEEQDLISEQGDVEESDASEYEQDEEEEDLPILKKQKKKKTNAKKSIEKTPKKPKVKRPSQRKAAKAARLVEAMRLRKKRMEELRVRNEEMQLTQSKEEQERAEKIAAKLDTQTEELKIKRLEDRLNLLSKLDQKRIHVVDDTPAAPTESEPTQPNSPTPTRDADDDEEDEESSDEEDLVIVGAATKRFKPLKPLQNQVRASALELLDRIRSPDRKQQLQRLQQKQNSPTRRSRNALRNQLKQQQRNGGNKWLARELGYKTEQEHLKECREIAMKKQMLTMKREQERIKSNERKQLRDRLMIQEEEEPVEDEGDAEYSPTEPEEEEDEEMQMAKELEKETVQQDDKHSDVEPSPPDLGEDSENEAPPSLLETQPMPESVARVVTMDGELPQKDHPILKDNEESQEATTPSDALEPIDNEGSATEHVAASEETSANNDDQDDGEQEFVDETTTTSTADAPKSNQPRNAGWQAMLRKEEEKLKKQKRRKGASGLVEQEAEEEEEEEVAGLEDFGFSIKKKKTDDDEDDDPNSFKLNEDDMKHVVDDVSDNEGDEEAGMAARKSMEQAEEKRRHKEMLRRMREGYDGRRGGIAGSSGGARGVFDFNKLVAADNREDAKRLGLLNDDELDSDNEDAEKKDATDDEDDELAFLDKAIKDRHLKRVNVDLEENFSDDDEENQEEEQNEENGAEDNAELEEERTQERLAKRFTKRARIRRLEEELADSQEFSQQRLIDEDAAMKQELKQMKNGLVRKRSISSSRSSLSSVDSSSGSDLKRQRSFGAPSAAFGGSFMDKSGSLSLALRASRSRTKPKTSFLGGKNAGDVKEQGAALIHKSVALSHVVFRAESSRSSVSNSAGSGLPGKRKKGPASNSFFRSIAGKNQ
eukprot:scaffold3399_cov117-Cylindrotheca_fusiformis.AAC.8